MGLLQGIEPALSGVANPAVSPRAAEVKFISHHALPLIAGSVLAGIAIAGLTLVLLLLVDATRFRRPESWRAARPLVLFGGIAVALVSIGHQVISAILTHHFVVGHDFSGHAVELALTKGTANVVSDYLDLLAGFALAAGMIVTMLGAMRVGLLVSLGGRARDHHRRADLPADRRRDAGGRARLLAGRDGHALRRALAGRRPAGLDLGRGAPVAVASEQRAAQQRRGARRSRGGAGGAAPALGAPTAPRASAGASAARVAAKDSDSSARGGAAVGRNGL